MIYCRRCVMPTTRPGLRLDAEGVCNACRWHETKKTIDWAARAAELQEVADWARRESRSPWHCVIGVSGGKDSTWQAVYARETLGLNPLLVQFAASDGTDLGRRNLENLVRLGFTLVSLQPNPAVARVLARKSFLNYGNIIKYSEYALFAIPFRIAMAYDIPLVFFGENPALEAGDTNARGHGGDASSIRYNNTLAGQGIDIWLGDGISECDLIQYRQPTDDELGGWGGRAVFMGYYVNWSGYENALFAIRHGLACLEARPEDIGSPHFHNALDCDNQIVNSMLKHVKLGFGSTTEFTAYDVRAGRLTRAEAIRLLRDLDGRCHPRYVEAFCRWVGLDLGTFWEVVESYRGPMWRRGTGDVWRLEAPIWEQEPADERLPLSVLIERLDSRRVAGTPEGAGFAACPGQTS